MKSALTAGNLEEVRACFSEEPGFPNVHDPLTWTPLLELAILWSPLALASSSKEVHRRCCQNCCQNARTALSWA